MPLQCWPHWQVSPAMSWIAKIDSVGVFFVFGVQRKLCQSGKPALCKGLPVETLEVPLRAAELRQVLPKPSSPSKSDVV